MNNKGFSLVESIIYMALAAVLIVTLTSFMVDVTKQAAYARQRYEIQHNVHRVATAILRDIRTAKSIAPISDSKYLSLVRENGQTITYHWNDSAAQPFIEINDGSGFVQFSTDRMRVTALNFQNQSANTDEVKVLITAAQMRAGAQPYEQYDVTFSATAVRRSSIY